MGNVTDLCFDKTGTLTLNTLSLESIVPLDGRSEGDIRSDLAVYVGNLATENRTAAAIRDAVGRAAGSYPKTGEVAFKSARRWGAVAFEGGPMMAMGAPEALVSDGTVLARAAEAAARGLRVVAFGTAAADGAPANAAHAPAGLADTPAGRAPVPAASTPIEDAVLGSFAPSALVALRDRVRDDVGDTLRALAARGINLRVISGDSLETVLAVARGEAGMEIRGAITTGPELDVFSGDEYEAAVARTSIFARIAPEQKRQIAASDQARRIRGDGRRLASTTCRRSRRPAWGSPCRWGPWRRTSRTSS